MSVIQTRTPSKQQCLLLSLVFLALVSCNDITGPKSVTSDVRQDVLDGRNGGAQGFYFLPPLAPTSVYPGSFDPDRSPVVEICALSTIQCSTVVQISGDRIKLSVDDQHYMTQWQTTSLDLNTTTTYRIRVMDLGNELGHADVRLVKKASDAKNFPASIHGVVLGSTLPIKFRIEKSTIGLPVSRTFDTNGGNVDVPLGGGAVFRIEIPSGALTEPVDFTFTPQLPASGKLASIDVTPGDILFRKPVTLRITLPSAVSTIDAPYVALNITASNGRNLIVPTSQATEMSFVGSTAILGNPASALNTSFGIQPGALRFAAATAAAGSSNVNAAVDSVQQRIDQLDSATTHLESVESFENAIIYELTAAALNQFSGDSRVASAIAAAQQLTCQKINTANAVSSSRLGADFSNLWDAMKPVIAWAASGQAVALDATQCPPLGEFPDVLDSLAVQFVDLYTAAMNSSQFPNNADRLRNELYKALVAQAEGQLLSMGPAFDLIHAKVQVPLAKRYRKAAYDWCVDQGLQEFIGPLFRAARDGWMSASSTSVAPQEPLVPENDFEFSADDLRDDLQYCGTRLHVRTLTSSGTPVSYGPYGGSVVPGSIVRTDTIDAPPHGKLVLDSTLVAFTCENENVDNERIHLDLNGVRVRELDPVGPTGRYIRNTPIVLDFDSLAQMAGVDLQQGGKFPLTFTRDGPACNGEYTDVANIGPVQLLNLFIKYPKIAVTISPTTATLQPGDNKTFTATVTGTSNTAVTWTVTGGTYIAVANSITFTAGSASGSYSVKARSVEDTARTATASVTIDSQCSASIQSAGAVMALASACGGLSISPGSVWMAPGTQRTFTASGTSSPVTWTATGGTISATGATATYTAGSTSGAFTVIASNADGVDTAEVVVSASNVLFVRLIGSTEAEAGALNPWEVRPLDLKIDTVETTTALDFQSTIDAHVSYSWEDRPDIEGDQSGSADGAGHGEAMASSIKDENGSLISIQASTSVRGTPSSSGLAYATGEGSTWGDLILILVNGSVGYTITGECSTSGNPGDANQSQVGLRSAVGGSGAVPEARTFCPAGVSNQINYSGRLTNGTFALDFGAGVHASSGPEMSSDNQTARARFTIRFTY